MRPPNQQLKGSIREAHFSEDNANVERSRLLNAIGQDKDAQRATLLKKLLCFCDTVPATVDTVASGGWEEGGEV